MSLLSYYVSGATWGPVGSTVPQALAFSAAYTALDTHEITWIGAVPVEDDALMLHGFFVMGRHTAGEDLQFRLRDITNGVTILETVLTGGGLQLYYAQLGGGEKRGPLTTMPAGNARVRFEYRNGGPGSAWYAAGWYFHRQQ